LRRKRACQGIFARYTSPWRAEAGGGPGHVAIEAVDRRGPQPSRADDTGIGPALGSEEVMGRGALLAVGGGGLSALASLALLAGSPGGIFLAYLAPLPLLLVGLGLGANAAAQAAATGLLVVALFGGLPAGGVYGGMHALPSWLVVHQALQRSAPRAGASGDGWYPLGTILATLAGIGALIGVSTALAAGGNEGIEAAIRDLLVTVMAMAAPEIGEPQQAMLVASLAPVFVGFSVANWQLMIAVNAILAQSVLRRKGWAVRPKPRWSEISLPSWLSWALVAAAAIALVASGDLEYLARNLVIVLATPFFFAGLAVVHRQAARSPVRSLILVLFYFGLTLFFAAVATAVAGAGMINQWRQRADTAPPGTHIERQE
jgi:hypothetical protein